MQKVAALHSQAQSQSAAGRDQGAALESPHAAQARLTALVNDSPAMIVQRRLVEGVDSSARVVAQRKKLDQLFRGAAQRVEIAGTSQADLAIADSIAGVPREKFLEMLKQAIRGVADEVLAELDQTADNCPYIDYWFEYYAGKDAGHIVQAINKYVPETKGMDAADLLIDAVAKKVRSGFEQHVLTGSLDGVPEELPSDLHETAQAKEEAPAPLTAMNPVVQLCGGNSEQDVPTDDAAALGRKLKTFKSSTSGGMTAARPDDFTWADGELDALGDMLIAAEASVAGVGGRLLYVLSIVQECLADLDRDAPETVTRRTNYETWKGQLLAHVSQAILGRWIGTIKAAVPAMPEAKYEHEQYVRGGTVEARQEGGARIGALEQGPLSALKRNDYARINDAYRKTQNKAGLLDGGLAIANYIKKGGKLVPSPGRMRRESNTLLGGGNADDVRVGDEHVEQGFAFFGGNASSIDDATYHLRVRLTSAIAYISYMYGPHETDWEYVTMPGARFRLDEIDAMNNVYTYTQL